MPTNDDAPRPALDAGTLERLRARYGEEEPPTCPACGAAMENDDDAGNFIPHRETWWRCPVDGERAETVVLLGHDPDVLALLDAYQRLLAAAAERDALAREAARLRRAVVLALDGPRDGEVGMETTMGRLNRIERQLRAALSSQEGDGDGR